MPSPPCDAPSAERTDRTLLVAAPDDGASTADAVSEAVSRLFLDKFGKGPIDVESFMHGDLVVTLMRDVLTDVERMMIEAGDQESVLVTRMLWQRATDGMFKAAVAGVTGREVLVVISGFELDRAMATEVFVLTPA